jgi:hypothetical protein
MFALGNDNFAENIINQELLIPPNTRPPRTKSFGLECFPLKTRTRIAAAPIAISGHLHCQQKQIDLNQFGRQVEKTNFLNRPSDVGDT